MSYLGAEPIFAILKKDSFTGNNTTTDFTLSHRPGKAEALFVIIDGVPQEPTEAYTVSNFTLSFTEAPYDGANIFVLYRALDINRVSMGDASLYDVGTGPNQLPTNSIITLNLDLYGVVQDSTETLLNAWKGDGEASRPRGDRTALLDFLIRDLESEGIWSKLDFLYVFAQFEERNGLYDIKSPSRSLPTPVNSPTFLTDEGYEGDGVDAHLELGFSRQDLSQFSQDDAHMGAFVLKDVDETGSVIGAADADNHAFLKPRDGGSTKARLNSSNNIEASVTAANGSFMVVRDASNSMLLYRNGEEIATSSVTSTALDDAEFTVLEVADQFSTQTVAAVHGGSALTLNEVQALYMIMSSYLQEVGAI